MKALAFEARNFCIYIHKTNSYKYQVKCTSSTTSPNEWTILEVRKNPNKQTNLIHQTVQHYTYIGYIVHRMSCGLALPMDHMLLFSLYKIIKLFVCFFSLLPQNILLMGRNMHNSALQRPPVYNGFPFVSKHPITKRMHQFLAHLSWKLKWAFLITFRPSSVCPSVRLSVCL